MTSYVKSRPLGLLRGTIVAMALLVSPLAAASVPKHSHNGSGHAVHFACRHCHHQFASGHSRVSMRTSRHVHRAFAMANRERPSGAWRHERVYGEHRPQNGQVVLARYQARHEAALELRREAASEAPVTARLNADQLRAGRDRDAEIAQWKEHEAPITAQLNLDQLRRGRESDAEISQWKSQYGAVAKGT